MAGRRFALAGGLLLALAIVPLAEATPRCWVVPETEALALLQGLIPTFMS